MGLDMFLTKENRITHKVDELIYWRKANAIHRFFLENGEIVQDKDEFFAQCFLLVTITVFGH